MNDRNDIVNQIQDGLSDGGSRELAEWVFDALRGDDRIYYTDGQGLVIREGVNLVDVAAEILSRIPTRVSIDARNDSWAAEWSDGRTDSGVIDVEPDDTDDDGLADPDWMLTAVESELGLPPGTLADAGKRGGWVWKRG